MPNVDPDFHYYVSPERPISTGDKAFRGLALVCAVGALAGLTDMLVSISLSNRLDSSILLYSVPTLLILSAILRYRTTNKHATYAGLGAFFISSLAHSTNLWIAELSGLGQFVEVWLAFVRAGLFAIYGLMMVIGFVMLASSDQFAHYLRSQISRC